MYSNVEVVMSSEKIDIKNYVKAVKHRLNNNHYRYLDDDVYYLCGEKLSPHRIMEINVAIGEIVASDDFVPDPRGRIVEKDRYANFTENQKMRYIFELSKIYLSIREKHKK